MRPSPIDLALREAALRRRADHDLRVSSRFYGKTTHSRLSPDLRGHFAARCVMAEAMSLRRLRQAEALSDVRDDLAQRQRRFQSLAFVASPFPQTHGAV